ncbi:MAG: hypothetical protein ABJL57_02410 [Hyphomonas sp.]|uniref:hypothetical protein n=1 Tax=Hyphomonas sp. TaxID=87 RepID=UPI003266CF90
MDACTLTWPWNDPKLELTVRDGNGPAEQFHEVVGYERQEVSVYSKWLGQLPETADRSATGPLSNKSRSRA